MATKSVLLIDFDNIFLNIWRWNMDVAVRFASTPKDWLPLLAGRHLVTDHRRWLVARCYLNPAGWVESRDGSGDRLYFSRFRPALVRAGFEVVDCPSMTQQGNNAADIRIVIDALDLLRSECRYEEFVIASSDSDFAPLLQRLRAHDRRVTVISPGHASAAYAALADQILGIEAIEALVEAELATADPPPAPAIGDPSAHPDQQAFADHIRARYAEAFEPLNLATLAQSVARAIPGIRERGWCGVGSFSRAIDRLRLPRARTSQFYLWDEERHQSPGAADVAADMPEAVVALVRALDLPRLSRQTWPQVFRVLARYAAERSFNLTESTRWTRDELAAEGVQVGRPALGYVVRGTQFGGAPLDRRPPPHAAEIASAFLRNLMEVAERDGVDLDPGAQAVVADWLGLPAAAT